MKTDILLLILILISPLFLKNHFLLSVITLAVIYSCLSLSWYFMERYTGWVSLSHSIPFGLAAYALAVNPYLLIPAIVFTILIFFLMSLLGRERFLFGTLILTVVFWYLSHYIVLSENGELIGGEEGFSYASIGVLNSYILSSIILLSAFFLLLRISKSSFGLKIAATRDDEIAARSIGIDVFRVRAMSFAISATLAAIAGICYILYFGHVSPDVFSIEVALLPFIASLLAGSRWISPIAGTFLVVMVSRMMGMEIHLFLYAAVLILSPKLSRWWNAEAH
ncbi:branched-chain amino acid ABC transporter permease [Archaeoglobus neptunius]|uniref:branched-chain amino acid ABC transporter permease n=1 Tax=Archaeoglobus neptunius TaxID=2798580 RepID=UPI0019284951|nr:branched-chain amino acid ABC transporter permease [Archaeoglobus neptunius]